MTMDQILILAFGFPTLGLLTSIFFKMGTVESTTNDNRDQIARLWNAINELRKETMK